MAFGRATAGLWGQEPDGRHDLPCVRVADFDRERLTVTTPVPTLRSIPPRDRPGRLLSRGDLLIEKSGGGERQPVGRVVFFDGEGEAVSSNFIARIPSRPKHLSRYSLYLHAALYSSGWNRLSIKQTTGIQNLDLDAYLDLKWRFPPFDEQQAIADYLDRKTTEIVDLVEKNRRNIRLLTEERQAVVRRAVTQGIDPRTRLRASGVPGLGDVPEHWEVRRLKQCARLVMGQSPPGQDCGPLPGRPFLQGCAEFGKRHPVPEQSCERPPKIAPQDSILLSVRAPVGRLNRADTEYGIGRGLCAILPYAGVLWTDFAYHQLEALQERLLASATGSTYDAVSVSDIGNHAILLPPKVEQARIAQYLDQATSDFGAAVATVRQEIELLTEYRARLIADVVTGRLDVRAAPDGRPERNEAGV